jgi:hypothetical protein
VFPGQVLQRACLPLYRITCRFAQRPRQFPRDSPAD